jgi:Uma2 family endonuclease
MAKIFPQPMPQYDPPRSAAEMLPTMYDLPSEDPEEPGLPDEFHDFQPQLLSRTLRLANYSRDNCFTASDLNLYYDVKHPLWQKRPDWFLAIDVPRLHEGGELRRSYVVWQEGESPYVIVEFLSPGTEREDLGRFYDPTAKIAAFDEVDEADAAPETEPPNNGSSNGSSNGSKSKKRVKPPAKFEVYEQYLRVPHYIVYSRYSQQLRYFKLDGGRYQEQPLQSQNPAIWLDDLEIGLGIWRGEFEETPGHWLRWCDRQGNWLLTDTEQAEAKLAQAARNLVATGMPIAQVPTILGLSDEQVQLYCQEATD